MNSEISPDLEKLLEGTPYRALARIGSGGMGEIYDAVGAERSDRVVVKVLRSDLRSQVDMVDRMRVEGEALELLRHPNIVGARGHGITVDGRPYVAMERLEGVTLHGELRRRGAPPLAEALHYARQLLSALTAVHDAGIVHRDIKPDNVMLAKRKDGPPELKLLDFGVAEVSGCVGQRIAPPLFPTQAGFCVGTPRYASPEQARGIAVDRRSDIYAAGIVLYMLVAGRGPFDEIKGAGNVLRAHASEDPPPPSRFTRYPIPGPLESVILRAIAKNANDRFEDAASFSRELLVTIARMCLPVDWMASRGEIRAAIDASRTRKTPDSSTSVSSARDRRVAVPVEVTGAGHGLSDAAPAVTAFRTTTQPGRRRKTHRTSVSGSEVLLSAAAFAAIAGGLAMWFAHQHDCQRLPLPDRSSEQPLAP